MSNLPVLTPPSNIKDLTPLINAIRNIDESLEDFEKSLLIGFYLQEIKKNLSPRTVELCRNLEGTGIGFKTDGKTYSDDVLRDCMVQAMIHGLRVHGNEFNILGGNFYATKEGLERVIKTHYLLAKEPLIEIKGMTKNKESKNYKFIFSYTLEYKTGMVETSNITFIVKGTTGTKGYETQYEAVEGKAFRKCFKEIYNKLSRNFAIKDSDDVSELTDIEETEKKSKLKQLCANQSS